MKVAGFGFRAAATSASLRDALDQAGGPGDLQALAVATDRTDAGCINDLAKALGLRVLAVSEDAVRAVSTLTQSKVAQRARGAGSLAEAVALVGAGPDASLCAPRVFSADRLAACAIAEGSRS